MAERLDFSSAEQIQKYAERYTFDELYKLLATEEINLAGKRDELAKQEQAVHDQQDRVTFFTVVIDKKHKAQLPEVKPNKP